jgi:Glycosyltransferase family 87
MSRPAFSLTHMMLMLMAVLCCAGEWLYVERVVIPQQILDATVHDRPRGNFSDLYPRWIGAKELLQNHRDPYTREVSREIQMGYYGRPLDSTRPNDPRDEAGFAYPVYVVFYLAPVIGLPFPMVQRSFFWILVAVTGLSIPLWLRILHWRVPCTTQMSFAALTLGSLAAVQGLKLQQISLFVAGLVVLAIALLVSGRPFSAGIMLALATVKPQLVVLLIAWLGIWTLADWRHRYRWGVSFLATLSVLCAASELLLPHWIPRFWKAIGEYQRYTGNRSVLENSVSPPWSWALELSTLGALLCACWYARQQPISSRAFSMMVSVVLAATVLLVPTSAQYNQVLLIPAVLLLVQDRRSIWQRGVANRVLFSIMLGLLVWPWFASAVLAVMSFVVSQASLSRIWGVPIWTTSQIPLGVTAMILVDYFQRTFASSERASTS